MTEPIPRECDAFSRSVELLHELHALSVKGQDESQAADDIREAMEPLWYQLPDTDRKRLEMLSAELYTREQESQQ